MAAGSSGPIEKKVTTATLTTLVLSIVIAILNGVQESPELLWFLPPWLQAIVIGVVPPVVVFATAYKTRHTPRPDVTGGSPNLSPGY